MRDNKTWATEGTTLLSHEMPGWSASAVAWSNRVEQVMPQRPISQETSSPLSSVSATFVSCPILTAQFVNQCTAVEHTRKPPPPPPHSLCPTTGIPTWGKARKNASREQSNLTQYTSISVDRMDETYTNPTLQQKQKSAAYACISPAVTKWRGMTRGMIPAPLKNPRSITRIILIRNGNCAGQEKTKTRRILSFSHRTSLWHQAKADCKFQQ